MSLRDTLLEQIRGRRDVLESADEHQRNNRKIIEPALFPGLISNNLMMHFSQFFNNEMCSDFTLILNRNDPKEVNGLDPYGNRRLNVIHAHKFILSQSEWFRAIFDSNMMEQLTNELVVNESEENLDAFTAMISIMYGNYVPSFEKLDSTLIGELLTCFDKYQAGLLFDRVANGLLQNCSLDTSKYRLQGLLWVYSMFGHRIKSSLLFDSISGNYLLNVWSKTVHTQKASGLLRERNNEFTEFFNKLDFNSCYFFLEEFVKPIHNFEMIAVSIDDWIKYDEPERFDKGFLLYRVVLNKKTGK